jgi:Fe-Mn family superoxide dismutase
MIMKKLQLFVIAIFALLFLASVSVANNHKTEHKFPELEYTYDALEPYVDAQTMELHYNKHHKGYYTRFLNAIEGTELANKSLSELFAKVSTLSEAVRNNGGGYYNHNLFWENMTPETTALKGILLSEINKQFGSVQQFKDEFANAASTVFGSGWAWLVLQPDGKLAITSTPNQDNPLMDVANIKGTPLLALDVWEHAYYLKYQNRRGDYIGNFWNVVNWDVVSERYQKAKK